MKKKLLNNWGLKLASLLFAFTLWFIVINVTDPTDEKKFYNIPVSLVNTDVLDSNKVYEVIDDTEMVRTVTVRAKTSVLRELTEEDIIAQADFNKLTATQTIEITYSSNRYDDDIDKISGNVEFVKLNIEDKKTKYLMLDVKTEGKVADGYLLENTKLDQNRITITGPESLVSKVSSAVVSVDVTDAMDNIATKGNVILYDYDGKEIASDSLQTSFESVGVNIRVNATKRVPLQYQVIGTPEEGYLYSGEVTSNMKSVLLAGSEEALKNIKNIMIPEDVLDITGQNNDMMVTLDLNSYLPSDVKLADSNLSTKATLTVHIEKEFEKKYAVNSSQIEIKGSPESYQIEIDQIKENELVVVGLKNQLDSIHESQLHGVIDIPGIIEKNGITEIKPGVYDVMVDFGLGEEIIVKTPVVVQINVLKKEE